MKYIIGAAAVVGACLAANSIDGITIDNVVDKNVPCFSQEVPKPKPKKEEKPSMYAIIPKDPIEELFSDM